MKIEQIMDLYADDRVEDAFEGLLALFDGITSALRIEAILAQALHGQITHPGLKTLKECRQIAIEEAEIFDRMTK